MTAADKMAQALCKLAVLAEHDLLPAGEELREAREALTAYEQEQSSQRALLALTRENERLGLYEAKQAAAPDLPALIERFKGFPAALQGCGEVQAAAPKAEAVAFDPPVGKDDAFVKLGVMYMQLGLPKLSGAEWVAWCAAWFGPDADEVYIARAVSELLAAPQPATSERDPLTADDLRQPKNGKAWRVEWWNERARLMLPDNMALTSALSYRSGTLILTLKKRAHGIGTQPKQENSK